MPLYEHVYLARQDASAQQVEELTAQLKGVIEGLGGTIKKTEYWGVKSLSYRLRKNRKAHYTLMDLDAPPAAINEIERLERLNEDVLRYLTIRVEALEEGPSAMMRRAERDRDREYRLELVGAAQRRQRLVSAALRLQGLQLPIEPRAGFGLIDALEKVFFFDHIAGASQTKQQSRIEGIVLLPLLQQVNRLVVTARFFEQIGQLHALSHQGG